MTKVLLSKLFIAIFCVLICLSYSSCKNNPQQNQPNTEISEINNQENEDENKNDDLSDDDFPESPLLSYSPYLHRNLALVENKIKVIMRFSGSQEEYQIYDDQVIAIKCDRFIFLKDGSIVDHLKERKQRLHEAGIKESFEPEDWDKYLKTEMTEEILNDYHKSIGIKDIRVDYVRGLYYVLLANGEVRTLGTDFNTKVNTSNSEDTNSDDKQKNVVLRPDGTLNCPQFPEAEEWTDIVDYRMASNFILALTSDGKLLSSGIEFEHENIVKFDIWDVCYWDAWDTNYGDLPIALTADGNLIFGELTSRDQVSQEILEDWDKQIETAKTFTDVEDFTFYGPNDDLYIIVQKSDGSIWATQHFSSFTEYVNIPDGVKISYDGEELPLPIPEYCCAQCDAVIPQGMSECPECSAQ